MGSSRAGGCGGDEGAPPECGSCSLAGGSSRASGCWGVKGTFPKVSYVAWYCGGEHERGVPPLSRGREVAGVGGVYSLPG